MHFYISFLLFALLGAIQALSAVGSRLLVVLDDTAEKSKYSKLLGDLESRGFSIDYADSNTKSLSLFQHGARAYDHLLVFPSKSKTISASLSAKHLLDFVNDEGNILITLSGDVPVLSSVQTLLFELDIHLPADRTSLVVDHFNYDLSSAAEKHDVLLLPAPGPINLSVKDYFQFDDVIAFPRAVGQVLGNESPLLTPILRAPSTAYNYNPKDESAYAEDPFAIGQQMSLISAMQARNSARLTVLGSAEMLENTWFDANVKSKTGKSKTANKKFAEELTSWTFKEVGVLKVGRFNHFPAEASKAGVANESALAAADTNPEIYRIKSKVSFQIELSEYSQSHLIPFTPATSDAVQLEFSMLSPFHRISLSPVGTTANSTIFGTTFVLPDQHGIFNFRVNYKRPFLTTVDEKRQVTVRHFAHDEWPRSYAISGAWTWVAGIWGVVVAWLAFVAVWLWSAPADEGKKKSGKKQ